MKPLVIENRIYEIRGQKIMLDFDLAEIYEVETRVLNQAIKRNLESFPQDFMFQLTTQEWLILSSSQFVMMDKIPKNRTNKYLPYAFTEHGVTMLASILKSPKARKMNIAIVRTFIALRQFALNYKELAEQVKIIMDRQDGVDGQLSQIYDALENLLDKKLEEKTTKEIWESRERIGFKNNN